MFEHSLTQPVFQVPYFGLINYRSPVEFMVNFRSIQNCNYKRISTSKPGMNPPKIKRRVGKYEVGRTIGEGTFAKVKFGRNSETGEPVALKILDKEKVLKHKMSEQIKREIATMKLIQHPNVVRLYE
ncbi:CBL-interacting serine/threonine-protein kinase 3, partial [Sarracenia purpurea var. burkii]